MKKYAIIMQYCALDFRQMEEACRLILGLQQERQEIVDLVLSVKPDAPINDALVAELEKKFDVLIMKGTRRDAGWPDGPNAQWYDTMTMVYDRKRLGRVAWEYVFTIEPDIVPLKPNWIDKLIQFVEVASTPVVGVISEKRDHVNGNMWVKPEWPHDNQMIGAPAGIAWDMYHGKINVKNATDCPLMKNMYKQTQVTEERLYAPRIEGIEPVFVHGIKDDSAIKIVKNRWGIK